MPSAYVLWNGPQNASSALCRVDLCSAACRRVRLGVTSRPCSSFSPYSSTVLGTGGADVPTEWRVAIAVAARTQRSRPLNHVARELHLQSPSTRGRWPMMSPEA
eukprot:8797-Prymnesium_polylepis.1